MSSPSLMRPPVVAIVGHVDHGKSTLLDTLRNTNVVDGEAGGITQHTHAYEVSHKHEESGEERRITFIDTPGHAAFSGMRRRGCAIADIAILIVSAEDSVKAQTKEAISIIKDNNVPFVVAINKIDKPNANPDKVKMDLMADNVYLEGYGGDVPFVEISAKTGQNLEELLDTILLLAELEEFSGIDNIEASGYVVEAHLDQKRGNTATLIIKNGTLKKGQYVVSGSSMAPTRIMESFNGKTIEEVSFSSPLRIIGFSLPCSPGEAFVAFSTKKEAEAYLEENTGCYTTTVTNKSFDEEVTTVVPVVLKCDVEGMIEAAAAAVEAKSEQGIFFKIIKSGVGDINESDVKIAATHENGLIIGFNTEPEVGLNALNEIEFVTINTFSIIYKMTEWLDEIVEKKRYREKLETPTGTLKLLKVFSIHKKNGSVVGGDVTQGEFQKGKKVKIVRKGEEIGYGEVESVQIGKTVVNKASEGDQCGCLVHTKVELEEGDQLIQFKTEFV